MVPQTYAALRTLLQSRMGSLSPGQLRIAELLLTDPEGTAFRTIAETAAIAKVHPSSLVRFANAVGLSGYPALSKLCREQLADQAQLVRRFELAQRHGASDELLAAVVGHDQRNLVRTFARIDVSQWDQVVELLASAPRVHIMGARKTLAVAQLLAYLLQMVRPDVHLIAPPTGGLVDALRDLRRADAFVGISIRRYTADTVRAMQHAAEQGLRTVALTDNPASPLATCAGTAFYVETGGVTMLRSLAAFVSLVQALATATGVHAGVRSRNELLQDEAMLDAFRVYYDSPVEPSDA